ncbi:KPN_02809 family neutral zinc metallopeptidase [Fulvivirga ligni]|uniref:KPN_02809 family neutral zinc metallopeptidase n=1 Tax=Fulvivirga ligni TaxID=2904246 RepID=UPI001F45A20B|nr:neutral zinc metallopeptidase [Fulvivirga ligni]UII23649.1 neutral zinc metallopeptidase [Fulvivirga ligni]
MKWRGRRSSSNIEDRRGRSGGRVAVGGGIGGVILVILYLVMGGDPSALMQQDTSSSGYEATAEEEELAEMVGVVLANTEDVWHEVFQERGDVYQEPNLVYFTGAVQSACGGASAAVGPFYCPADSKVYIDLSFYQQMKNELNAPGDFAMAYVVAHEVGHHIQNLLGISKQVQAQRGSLSQTEYNALSVKLELQADYLAGMWAHYAQNDFQMLEEGDIEEALNAANAIGDDRLQKKSQGYVVPDAFTHGTSEQRVRWFKKGFVSGQLEDGDTFKAQSL